MTTTATSREELIEAIVSAARRPCPEIVERFAYRDRETGKEYGSLGIPFGFDRSRLDRVSVGYVYRDRNGTHYGIRYPSREAAAEAHVTRTAKMDADFRAQLTIKSESDLQSQADYWLA